MVSHLNRKVWLRLQRRVAPRPCHCCCASLPLTSRSLAPSTSNFLKQQMFGACQRGAVRGWLRYEDKYEEKEGDKGGHKSVNVKIWQKPQGFSAHADHEMIVSLLSKPCLEACRWRDLSRQGHHGSHIASLCSYIGTLRSFVFWWHLFMLDTSI